MSDDITAFYDRHPYPPPVADLDPVTRGPDQRRLEFHRVWPTRSYREDLRILVAGCGTSQAARWAVRHPGARVVGIEVSRAGIEAHERLADQHDLDNLELHLLPIEQASDLGRAFDLIVCTGVLHHLADPAAGLAALRSVLAPGGAMRLMVYATYGRLGVSMIQDYCRRLGIDTSELELTELVASLRELPLGHPLSHLLRRAPDFQDDDALADALLNPRERSYTVPEFLTLIEQADLRFTRWVRQAPYLPTCGSLSEIPHGPRIARLPQDEQYAAVELFRGTITQHHAVAHHPDSPPSVPVWSGGQAQQYVPVRPPTAIAVEEGLPPGVAAALLNKAHRHPDLVLFAEPHERRVFDAIDGRRTVAELSDENDVGFVRRLWRHDLVQIDASTGR